MNNLTTLTKGLLKTLAILLGLAVSGCSTLEVPNVNACVELTRGDAACFWSIEGPDTTIGAGANEIERVGKISLTPTDFGKLRKTIEKACELATCTIEEKEITSDFFLKYQDILDSIEKPITNEVRQ